MKKPKIRLFEAFAGIGSQYYALKRLKNFQIEIAGISEWDIKALHAYRKLHYPDIHDEVIDPKLARKALERKDFSNDGISKYDLNKLSDNHIVRLFNTDKIVKNYGSVQNLSNNLNKKKYEKVNIFVYSFPCQDLATGGKGLGMKKGSGTRSGLLWELENYLYQLNKLNLSPDILLLENVRTIYSPTHREDLNLWLDFLRSIGYNQNIELLLNALDYGLPQNRKRAFIISINKRLNVDTEKLKASIYDSKTPIDKLNINDFVKIGYNATEEKEAWLNRTPSREEMWKINKKDLSLKPLLGTITCNLDRSNNAGMFKYRNSYRLLTMREAFLLMGFGPEVYKRLKELDYSYRQLNKLIGNSIAINVLEVIFKNILKFVSF
jgi:DNA (cytosine-5)-methyltransferase 1